MANRKLRATLCFLVSSLLLAKADIEYQSVVGENNYQPYRNAPALNAENFRAWNRRETVGKPVENVDWQGPEVLGQISGVAVDRQGRPIVFHRADRVWRYSTFSDDYEYQEQFRGAIAENTVLTLSPQNGQIIAAWGNRTFYLPHGIHVDFRGNVWLTDVALHQIFKYDKFGNLQLILGERFVPGSDLKHFCQPTSVAVANGGEIFVADGYCNSRVIVFDEKGDPKFSIGEPWINFWIPHSLTILSNGETCVADRENSRIVCLDVDLRGPVGKLRRRPYYIRHHKFHRIFGVASYGNIVYALNSVNVREPGIAGFTVDPARREVIDIWGPETGIFLSPHAIGIDPNGSALYISEIGPSKLWKFDLLQFDVTM